jgi:hypothetical protein
MAKTHLRRNTNAAKPIAACAANTGKGVSRNSRATFQGMASPIVSWAEFNALPVADLCAHCCDAALIVRNRQRAAKGLPPVAAWNQPTAL